MLGQIMEKEAAEKVTVALKELRDTMGEAKAAAAKKLGKLESTYNSLKG